MLKENIQEIRQLLLVGAGILCIFGTIFLSHKGKSSFISALLVFSGIALFSLNADIRKLVFDVSNFAKIEMEKTAEEVKRDISVEVSEIKQGVKVLEEFMNNQKTINAKLNENNSVFDVFRENQESFNESLVNQIKSNKADNNNLLENLRKSPESEISNISDSDKFQKFQSLIDENGKYNVLIFFRGRRAKDAERMNEILLNNGYKSSSVQTSLKEVLVGSEPEIDTTAIISSSEFKRVSERVLDLISKYQDITKGSVSDWGEYPLKKGHVQIYLF